MIRRRGRMGALPACVLMAACVAGGGEEGPSATQSEASAGVVDDRGRTLDSTAPRLRIVSLIPSATETLAAIGALDRLVARTDYDGQPELAHLPSVGGGLDPSLEFLVQLDPDLVVLWRGAAGADPWESRLDDLGVDTYAVAVQTIADFRRLARNLGRLAGLERAADSVVAGVDAQMARARASWEGRRQPVSAMYVTSRAPAIAAGGGTFIDSVMAAAGLANAFGDMGAEWPQVSLEEIVWRDPHYLIVPVASGVGTGAERGPGSLSNAVAVEALAAEFAGHAGWAEVPAVVAGRIVPVDANLFGRPGPRMGEAALRLAERLR